MTRACNEDLVRYKNEIERDKLTAGKKVEMMWNSIKLVLRKKSSERMQSELHHHATKLSHQFSIMQQ